MFLAYIFYPHSRIFSRLEKHGVLAEVSRDGSIGVRTHPAMMTYFRLEGCQLSGEGEQFATYIFLHNELLVFIYLYLKCRLILALRRRLHTFDFLFKSLYSMFLCVCFFFWFSSASP